MKLDPEALYVSFGNIVASMPDLAGKGPITPEINQWIGRAAALVEASCPFIDTVQFNTAAQNLDSAIRDQNAQTIAVILYRALARAELAAPSETQGAFIPVGDHFTAFSAVSKVLGSAHHDALIVDPYADAKALTDFAVLASEGVIVRVLSDAQTVKPSLSPAATNWIAQYGVRRPLEVRLAPARSLHDRLIVADCADVWALTQSLKDFAGRSPASIVKVVGDTASLKIAAYDSLWKDAVPL
jgi:hypothetical protein